MYFISAALTDGAEIFKEENSMRKKMLSLVLALIMVLALLPVSTVAANATVTQVIP